MIETKSLRVGPAVEQSMIDTMACFGWELKSSQEINVKESHEELHGDTVYSVTTGENYVKLVFNRDTARPHYARYIRNRHAVSLNGKTKWQQRGRAQ